MPAARISKKRLHKRTRIRQSGHKPVLVPAGKPEDVLGDMNGMLAPHGCRCEAVPGNFGDGGREYAGVIGKSDAPFWSIGDMMLTAPGLCEGVYYIRRGAWSDRMRKISGKFCNDGMKKK